MKSQYVQRLYGNGEGNRPIKDTYPHIASTPREVGVSHDHEFRSFVRLLCLTRAPPPQLEERSVLGQSGPNWAVRAMSDLLPVSTGSRTSQSGSFVPDSDFSGEDGSEPR